MSPTYKQSLQPLPVKTKFDQQAFLQEIGRLPKLMKVFVDSEKTIDLAIALVDAYGLNGLQNKAMIYLEGEIIVKHLRPADVLNFVRQHIFADENQAKKFTTDFLGQLCLPMQWYIGNVEGIIKELGGDVEKYIAEAQKNYPEVYAPNAQQKSTETDTSTAASKIETSTDEHEPVILQDIGEKLGTSKGRAGVLLHLVALSQKIETAGKSGQLSEKETGELLHSLDALSYAVNTQDLNPLEIAAIKRRLKNILVKVGD